MVVNTPWFSTTTGSWSTEFIPSAVSVPAARILWINVANSPTPMYLDSTGHLSQYDVAAVVSTANTVTANAIQKGVTTWATGNAKACLNSGAVASSATLTTGYSALLGASLYFLQGLIPGEAQTGYIRRINYWNRALSDTEMQQVTT
jgi:hypothetical protein